LCEGIRIQQADVARRSKRGSDHHSTRANTDRRALRGRYTAVQGNLKRRLLREGLKEERCEGCGLHRWQGVPLPLALHHVNGDRDDNRLIIPGATCHRCQAAGGERRRHVVDGPCARRRRVSDAPPAEGRRDVSVMLETMGVLDL
jgi:hypothetical protein